MISLQRTILIALVLTINACGPDRPRMTSPPDTSTQFSLLSPSQSGVDFANDVKETREFHHLLWESVFYGGGVAIGDINNDNLADLYFTGNQVSDALYLNKGNMQFEDISGSSGIAEIDGWSTGVTMADINADGLLDIYVCRSWWDLDKNNVEGRRNKLFINNGDLTFSEEAAAYGLDDPAYSTQATFFDYDRDGDLDMYLMNAPSNNFQQKLVYMRENRIPYMFSDKLYENIGRGRFSDRTRQAGVENYAFGLGIVATDINGDQWTDLYVACDYEQPDKLFINNKDGTFTDRSQFDLKHTSYSSMGCDIADFNNDLFPDIAVLDMQAADHIRAKTNMRAMNARTFWQNVGKGYGYQYMSNVLQLNNGYGFYSEIGQLAGIAQTDWSWSVLLADFDNDQYKDMFVTNGVNRDMRNSDLVDQMDRVPEAERAQMDLFKIARQFPSEKISNYLFLNKGDLTFENATDEWGLEYPGFSYGAAYGDLDNDGDLDLVVNNSNDVAHVYRNNNLSGSNFLQLRIRGSEINPIGLGTKAVLYDGQSKQSQELTLTRGYQSSVQPLLHFGLGSVEKADSIHVIFPNGRWYRAYDIDANQELTITAQMTTAQAERAGTVRDFSFQEVSGTLGIDFVHRENHFDDFAREILLPHAESKNGPYIAVGDVDGDAREDFFIGGASGIAGALFRQTGTGTFQRMDQPDMLADAAFEDLGCTFADIDGDRDLDLYIVSGGNEFEDGSPSYGDRLYLNDGHGNFLRSAQMLPALQFNGSCVAPCDYDGDGDIDLFVGHRGLPGQYPRPGKSILLENTGSGYEDVTLAAAPDLMNAGMVTDACWSDFDQDEDTDLILVGEWMSPLFLRNTDGRLEDVSVSIMEKRTGWWFDVTAADVDGDGDEDYIVGNMGMNNKYHPTNEKPLMIYGNDFDNNNTNDVVLAKHTEFGDVPVRGRECSSEQMPFIAQKFPDYNSFAHATLEEIYGDALEESVQRTANEFRSGVLINEGGTQMRFEPFPNAAQIAPVQASIAMDVNQDGHLDLLLAGNHFDAEVETVRHDAGNGLVLLGRGTGTFDPQPVWKTLFYVPFNTRDMAVVETSAGPVILAANNNFRLMAYVLDRD